MKDGPQDYSKYIVPEDDKTPNNVFWTGISDLVIMTLLLSLLSLLTLIVASILFGG